MRITSGIAKGHIVRMPAGPAIRPTLDMARKAIFDIIGSAIKDARFLDLFAGTGANGIEALSRGAKNAVFVDSSRFCIKAIRENLEKTRLIERAEICQNDVFEFIKSYSRRERNIESAFDVVFADPPYYMKVVPKTAKNTHDGESSAAKMTLQTLSSTNILSISSVVIIEHPLEKEMPDCDGNLAMLKTRCYGSTAISIYRKK
jgi:16S rRNA (guanine966-N2)-methyltransferase